MKVYKFLLAIIAISYSAFWVSGTDKLGLGDERYVSLEHLARRFGPRTFTKLHILPEDDELNFIRRASYRIGKSLVDKAVSEGDIEIKSNLIDRGIPWLCMAEALCDDEARAELVKLGMSDYWKDFSSVLMDDLKFAYEKYRRDFWNPTYRTSARGIYLNPAELPRGFHHIDRSRDWLKHLVGAKVLPSAEERIAQRLRDFEEAMAILDGGAAESRRVSDASTESAESAEVRDVPDTEPFLPTGHLKAE
jgi:hypothetical protein